MEQESANLGRLIGEAPKSKISRLELQVPGLPGQGGARVPLILVKGQHPGPCCWMSAAIHGNELNGIEVIHRLVKRLDPHKLHGTILALPIVNIYGFLNESRYLPDRRDLNRCFPGSKTGSLASRVARFFNDELLSRCDFGLDFHTAAEGNRNILQVRTNLTDPDSREMARQFGAPFTLHSALRDGSLRHAAFKLNLKMLVVELGASQRFDDLEIDAALDGSLRLLKHLQLYKASRPKKAKPTQFLRRSSWHRAAASGIFKTNLRVGDKIQRGQRLGWIQDAFGETISNVLTKTSGFVIGLRENPMIYQGDALVNLGLPEE